LKKVAEAVTDMYGLLKVKAAHGFGRDDIAEPVAIFISTSTRSLRVEERQPEPLSLPAMRTGPITEPETLPIESLAHGSYAVVAGTANASQNPVADVAIPSRASLAEPRRDFALPTTERGTTATN